MGLPLQKKYNPTTNYQEVLWSVWQGRDYNMALGEPERIIGYNTCQVAKYDNYELGSFSEEAKHAWRDAHWEEDLQKAYDAGRNMAEWEWIKSLFCRYARPQNAHLRLSKLSFFGHRTPKTTSFYSLS